MITKIRYNDNDFNSDDNTNNSSLKTLINNTH